LAIDIPRHKGCRETATVGLVLVLPATDLFGRVGYDAPFGVCKPALPLFFDYSEGIPQMSRKLTFKRVVKALAVSYQAEG